MTREKETSLPKASLLPWFGSGKLLYWKNILWWRKQRYRDCINNNIFKDLTSSASKESIKSRVWKGCFLPQILFGILLCQCCEDGFRNITRRSNNHKNLVSINYDDDVQSGSFLGLRYIGHKACCKHELYTKKSSGGIQPTNGLVAGFDKLW